MVSESKLLSHYGLQRHPFTDRTAEKTELASEAVYVHADLKGAPALPSCSAHQHARVARAPCGSPSK
eukprot:10527753-Ditylum_brightwellii.AAC.1